ncbi:MAG: carbon-nitrogen hydrolase family protein [Alphaproteobacteria bacterium]
MATFTAALVQTSSGIDMAANLVAVERMVREAVDRGADVVLTPENVAMMQANRAATLANARDEAEHEGLARLAALAREAGIWLLIGSLHVKLADGRLANRSYLVGPDGAVAARYDKIHMFDVTLAGGESYRESATFAPGDRAVAAATPFGAFGLTICYDMRFPALYRALAEAGAVFLTAPSAFTRPTGQAHWHVLLRARAIETGCFMFAPAQCGEPVPGRKTYGHSLIVSPWGEVLAEAGEEPGIVLAEIDPAAVEEARSAIPALAHGRGFAAPQPVEWVEARPDRAAE